MKILRRGIAFIPPHPNAIANYAFIDDVVEGHFSAVENGLCGQKYILGGDNISYTTFFQTIRMISGNRIILIQVPQCAISVWSFVHMINSNLKGFASVVSPRFMRQFLQDHTLSSEKAVNYLGYHITPFTEGMRKTLQHIQILQNG